MELIFRNFSTGYTKSKIVKNISFKLNAREWIGIIGANGSGKSTLLKGVLKFIPTLSGDIFLNGISTNNYSRKELSKKISYLPQKLNNNLNITVKDLITLGRSPYKKFWDFNLNNEDTNKIEEAIEIVELKNLKDKFITELSGGQCQRAYLAMVIAQDPKIMFLDEPTTFLDINHQIKFLESLKELIKEKNISIITVLHDINLAARFCHRIAILKNGKLLEINTPKKIMNEEIFKKAFDVDSLIVDTQLGPQLLPVSKKE